MEEEQGLEVMVLLFYKFENIIFSNNKKMEHSPGPDPPPSRVAGADDHCHSDEKIMNKISTPRSLSRVATGAVRCYCCKRKLKMFEQSTGCDCGHLFCSKHMNRHSHNCTFDMKTRRQKEIVVNNPKMEEKMVKV